MALFKCKICGGTLAINNNETVATCEYCGMRQTLPKLDDERRANLYDRANHFRRNNEFDKAMGIYEQILNEDNTDAEAYWSLVLCRYGIEYVEDPISYKRIPTVNRTQFTSVFDDDNYKSALQYADSYQRNIYEEEAKAINEIQKGILAISQKEEPFDVFICYKESDSDGRRTHDSVLANDLYHQLSQEGFKVFFARITLEDKLGSAYEPHIFAALNSAKVMVVLGTKPEYFKAVWVRNEWSRYLSLIKQGKKKMLIPAYKDMDPYDLPEEFSHLQAQDMSKLGFMQDLIRGIRKIVRADAPKATVVKETIIAGGSSNTTPLLKRAFMFLEDGDWDSANDYCEKVLDIDPENARAYLGKLMAELQVRKEENLKDCDKPFDGSNNYQKVIRFADEKLRATLIGYMEQTNTRNENARKDAILAEAKSKMTGDLISKYQSAIELLESISGWKDADKQIDFCKQKIGELEAKRKADRLEREHQAEIKRKEAERRAKRKKKITIITVSIVCIIIAFIVVLNNVIIPNSKYNNAVALMDAGKFDEAYNIFQELDDYKDATEKAGNIRLIKTKEQLKNVKVGDYITFGSYEQDNNTLNGKEDIEWLVLEVKDGKALLISKYGLDCKQYHIEYKEAVTWETCTLRTWLNNDFINTAFTAEGMAMIPTVTVSQIYSNATKDKVFLLSSGEAIGYFGLVSARQCKPTDFALSNGVWEGHGGDCCWWLRSPGDDEYSADSVDSNGSIYERRAAVCNEYAVRPALWIDLNS